MENNNENLTQTNQNLEQGEVAVTTPVENASIPSIDEAPTIALEPISSETPTVENVQTVGTPEPQVLESTPSEPQVTVNEPVETQPVSSTPEMPSAPADTSVETTTQMENTNEVKEEKPKKSKSGLVLFIILILLVGASYFLYTKGKIEIPLLDKLLNKNTESVVAPQQQEQTPVEQTPVEENTPVENTETVSVIYDTNIYSTLDISDSNENKLIDPSDENYAAITALDYNNDVSGLINKSCEANIEYTPNENGINLTVSSQCDNKKENVQEFTVNNIGKVVSVKNAVSVQGTGYAHIIMLTETGTIYSLNLEGYVSNAKNVPLKLIKYSFENVESIATGSIMDGSGDSVYYKTNDGQYYEIN